MIRLDEAAGMPAAGGKAELLARARRAGLAVPDGIVLLPDEEIDEPAIATALAKIDPRDGARFAVRSSADVEDREGGSAAGVFESVVGVALPEIASAIERVRASVGRESARAYLGSRGLGRARMAVLIQPVVEASALGVLHTAPLVDGKMAAEERSPDQPEWGEVVPREVAASDPLAVGAARLAALVGAAADVEYALAAVGPVFLQARPIVSPIERSAEAWDPGDDGRWRRDAEHNPEPLSMAQASMVALVAGLPGVPPQRVLHGFLFFRTEGGAPPTRIIPPPSLPRVFAEEIVPACDAALACAEGQEEPSLEAALAAYRIVVALHAGVVGPSLRGARALLDQLLRDRIGEPLSAHGALLSGIGGLTVVRDAALHRIGRVDPLERPRLIATYAERFGAYAPAWDVAVATDGELPTRVMGMAALVGRGASPEMRGQQAEAVAQSAKRALCERLDRPGREGLLQLLPMVRAALPIAEDDDALFFRAQRAVRRALLSIGERRYMEGALPDPSLIFDLPVAAAAHDAIDVDQAMANRAARIFQAGASPPSEIRGRRATWRGGGGGVLRGAGTSGRGFGRAFVLRNPASAPATLPRGAVLVTPAILPSLSYLLPGASGLITDHGGALSHGATLAREYGVPAVLGTGRATELILDGEELIVDGDGGRVFRIAGG